MENEPFAKKEYLKVQIHILGERGIIDVSCRTARSTWLSMEIDNLVRTLNAMKQTFSLNIFLDIMAFLFNNTTMDTWFSLDLSNS